MASHNLWNLILYIWKLAQMHHFLNWVFHVAWGEFIQTVYLTEEVEMWWDFKDFINYS